MLGVTLSIFTDERNQRPVASFREPIGLWVVSGSKCDSSAKHFPRGFPELAIKLSAPV